MIDHTHMVQKQVQFNCNAALLKTNLTVKDVKSLVQTEEQQTPENQILNNDSKDEQGSRQQRAIFSITNHFALANNKETTQKLTSENGMRTDNKNDNTAEPAGMKNRGEKQGTSSDKT